MPDLTMSVTVSRTLLSLSALELNDHADFYVAGSNVLGEVSYQKNQVSSPYVDRDITVNDRQGNVTEELVLEVLGTSAADLRTNLAAAIAAFKQAEFTLTVTVDGQTNAWLCERKGYQVVWSGPRLVAHQCQLKITYERSPIPTTGSF